MKSITFYGSSKSLKDNTSWPLMYVCVINIKRAVEVSFSLTMTLATYQLLFLLPFVFSDVGPLNKSVRDIFNEKIDCSVTYRSMQMPKKILELCDLFCEWQAQNSYIETLCRVGMLKEGALYEAQMVQHDTGWSRGLEWFKMVPCGTRWCQVI